MILCWDTVTLFCVVLQYWGSYCVVVLCFRTFTVLLYFVEVPSLFCGTITVLWYFVGGQLLSCGTVTVLFGVLGTFFFPPPGM